MDVVVVVVVEDDAGRGATFGVAGSGLERTGAATGGVSPRTASTVIAPPIPSAAVTKKVIQNVRDLTSFLSTLLRCTCAISDRWSWIQFS